MTEKEMLQLVLDKMTNFEKDIRDLKEGQEALKGDIKCLQEGQRSLQEIVVRIEQRVDRIENISNATYKQTGELTEFRTETNFKLDSILDRISAVEVITKDNLFDIAKLKMIK